jgi:hypothetical protein
MEGILIEVVDGRKNFPEGITTVFSVGQRADRIQFGSAPQPSTESRKMIRSRKGCD